MELTKAQMDEISQRVAQELATSMSAQITAAMKGAIPAQPAQVTITASDKSLKIATWSLVGVVGTSLAVGAVRAFMGNRNIAAPQQ